jgi:glycerol-3-phosphate acyltransferase PlsY
MTIVALIAALCAFTIGSIPFGILVGKQFGTDPRKAGSRNIGATNVARLLGWKCGIAVLTLDVAKGALATWLGLKFGEQWGLVAGFCATLGHCYSPWLKGAGGKGVATALGVLLVADPTSAGLALFVWIATAAFFRIAAVSSLLAVFTIVVVCRLNQASFDLQIFTLALFFLITIRHTSNLKQLKKRWFGKTL